MRVRSLKRDILYRKLVNKTIVWRIDYGFGILAYFSDILSIIRYNTSFVKRSASNDSVSSAHTHTFSRGWKAAFLLFCTNNQPNIRHSKYWGRFILTEWIHIYLSCWLLKSSSVSSISLLRRQFLGSLRSYHHINNVAVYSVCVCVCVTYDIKLCLLFHLSTEVVFRFSITNISLEIEYIYSLIWRTCFTIRLFISQSYHSKEQKESPRSKKKKRKKLPWSNLLHTKRTAGNCCPYYFPIQNVLDKIYK